MSDAKRTPGPLRMIRGGINGRMEDYHLCLYGADDQYVTHLSEFVLAESPEKANEKISRITADAEHIVHCWNACEGINPEAVPYLKKLAEIVLDEDTPVSAILEHARAAIEKAKPA